MRRFIQAAVITAGTLIYVPIAAAHDADEAASFGGPGNAAHVNRVIAITMNDMSFNPAALKVETGETIRFVVTNKSPIEHEFVLGDAKSQAVHRHMMAMMEKNGMTMDHHDTNVVSVGAGQTKDLIWHFSTTGQYEFDCNIPGHYEAGMKGTITVGPKA